MQPTLLRYRYKARGDWTDGQADERTNERRKERTDAPYDRCVLGSARRRHRFTAYQLRREPVVSPVISASRSARARACAYICSNTCVEVLYLYLSISLSLFLRKPVSLFFRDQRDHCFRLVALEESEALLCMRSVRPLDDSLTIKASRARSSK